ncbi:uncharacterized protein LOC144791938 [Lissotriton helveticus]
MAGAGGLLENITQRVSMNLTDIPLFDSTTKSTLDGHKVSFVTSAVSTNMNTSYPTPPSGIVPGIIAASLFISFLLCLYAILWKCMVSMPKRQMKRQNRRRPPSGLLPEKTLC